jgi:hypothetical protein
LWLKPSSNWKFLMFNHTLYPCSKFTSPQNLFTKPLYYFWVFWRLAWPFLTSVTFLHQVAWPLALPNLNSLGLPIHGPSHKNDWWLVRHHLKRCGPRYEMFWILVVKLDQLQMVHPILLIWCNIIS